MKSILTSKYRNFILISILFWGASNILKVDFIYQFILASTIYFRKVVFAAWPFYFWKHCIFLRKISCIIKNKMHNVPHAFSNIVIFLTPPSQSRMKLISLSMRFRHNWSYSLLGPLLYPVILSYQHILIMFGKLVYLDKIELGKCQGTGEGGSTRPPCFISDCLWHNQL